MVSKGDQAAQRTYGFRSGLGGIPTSGDEHLVAPDLPEELIRLQIVAITVFDAGDARFDGMKISKVGEPFLNLRDEVGKGRFGVLHLHSLPGVPGGDTESDSVFANGVGDGFDDFEREPGTVLNRSTIFICPLIRDVLEELVWEISVGEESFPQRCCNTRMFTSKNLTEQSLLLTTTLSSALLTLAFVRLSEVNMTKSLRELCS